MNPRDKTADPATELPIVEVRWPEAERFAAIQSQLFDLDIALNCLRRLRELLDAGDTDPVSTHALYVAALNYYGRCFKSGVRRGFESQNLILDEKAREHHDRLLALRDKYIAHSVNALDQVAVGFILSGREGNDKVVDVVRMRLRAWDVAASATSLIEDHIRSVRRQVAAANQEAYEALLEKGLSCPANELASLPPLELTVPDHDDLDVLIKRR